MVRSVTNDGDKAHLLDDATQLIASLLRVVSFVKKHFTAALQRSTYPPFGRITSDLPMNVRSNHWPPCNKHGTHVHEGLQGEALL
jgi:hypothetical protein